MFIVLNIITDKILTQRLINHKFSVEDLNERNEKNVLTRYLEFYIQSDIQDDCYRHQKVKKKHCYYLSSIQTILKCMKNKNLDSVALIVCRSRKKVAILVLQCAATGGIR